MTRETIINTWDQLVAAGGTRVAILHRVQDTGRASQSAAFQVMRMVRGREVPTDPGAAWYDHGHKTFLVSLSGGDGATAHARRAKARETAIAWADKTFGKREYVRNRMGDYVEREVNERFPIRRTERSVPR